MTSPQPIHNVIPSAFAAWLAQEDEMRAQLVVVLDNQAAEILAAQLAFFAPKRRVLVFPGWDCLPYDRVSPQAALMTQRLRVLQEIQHNSQTVPICITTVNAMGQKIVPPAQLQQGCLRLQLGMEIARQDLLYFLVQNGYQAVGAATEAGEFSTRGSLLDIVPAGAAYGLRLDFFGDELEQIKQYDPLTQLSSSTQHQQHDLLPSSEMLLQEAHILHFKQRYREFFGGDLRDDMLYESISAGRKYAGMEHWLGLCHELVTLKDYLPHATILCTPLVLEAAKERADAVQDSYQARQQMQEGHYRPAPPETLYDLEWPEHSVLQSIEPMIEQTMLMAPAPNVYEQAQLRQTHSLALLKELLPAQQHAYCLLACSSEGARERLTNMLAEYEIPTTMIDAVEDRKKLRRKGGRLGLVVLPLETGFVGQSWYVLSEQDVLGSRLRSQSKARKKPIETLMQEAMNLTPGELVVHKQHGIGQFKGLLTLDVQGVVHDMVHLVYAGDDILYVPVENVDLISRYGEESESIALDKLGGVAWQERHAGIKKRIKMAAEALLGVAAKRATRTATSYHAAALLYERFADAFPYNETEDQLRAIADVEADLASGKPMDRLICGDVGFGKTEIAMRAAHIVACPEAAVLEDVRVDENQAGQVLFLAPTTLLARQHYHNLQARFAKTGLRIAQLSRLVPPKQAKEAKAALAAGEVDIVVGTHALLAEDVACARLGLVVVDEEQRFGVKQKERLKRWRANVHVLTLSATPIPRTLQLSLTGIRELSLIASPPVDRLAVRTQVMPFDGHIIREALLREHYRGGRSYYVCPRVRDLEEVEETLRHLVPELKIASAHGRTPAKQLEQIMVDFDDGKYDVLIATTIIESGLDIAAANTLIVHRADHYGLAQLYQIRGRVGRSKLRAFAYLTLPPRRVPSKQAQKRLDVMLKLDHLGAGFTLASHDMDMRGFGNLLGEEQSGNIKEVGVELYQHMLKEAILALKQGDSVPEEEDFSPQIKLGISVLIPEEYMSDIGLRMRFYRRIAALKDEAETNAMEVELVDRFGSVPSQVAHLLDIVRLKQRCKLAHIAKIEVGQKGAVVSFHNRQCAAPEALIQLAAAKPDEIKLRPDHTVFMPYEPATEASPRIKQLQEQVERLVRLGDAA